MRGAGWWWWAPRPGEALGGANAGRLGFPGAAGGWSGFGGAPRSFHCLGAASPHPISGFPEAPVHVCAGDGEDFLELAALASPPGWGRVG